MNKEIFKVNERIFIMLTVDSRIKQYASRIEEVYDDNLHVAMPMAKGIPIILLPGEIIFARMIADTSVFQFSCKYLDKLFIPIPVWKISFPDNIEKIQQRSFVRLSVSLSFEASMLCAEESKEEMVYQFITKDLSGGGMQVVSKLPIPDRTKLKAVLLLPDIGKITAICEVVRSEQPQSDRPIFWVGLRFLEISESDRTKIIKFIFSKQLERRRREL